MKALSIKRTIQPDKKLKLNEWFSYIREAVIEVRKINGNQYSKP